MTTLLTLGTFDTPHMGHAAFLRRCERFADAVVVGVNSDAFVASYKGAAPAFSYDERAALVSALGYEATPNDGPGWELIEAQLPDVVAVGSDWATRRYHDQIQMTQARLDELGIALVFIPYTPGISTTELRRRLA